jgi:predicted  nucleic acid-binding Zn-ribbon protein
MVNQALKQIGNVQKVDSAILELQRRFAHIDPGKAVAAELAAAKAQLDEKDNAYKAVRTEIEDLELKNKGIESKVESEKKKLYSGGVYNAKDAENIEKAVQNQLAQRSQNDDRLLELWEQLEPAKKAAEEQQAEYAKVEAKAKEYAQKYAAAKTDYEQRLAKLVAAREQELQKCDPKYLAKYDAMRQKRNGIGLAAVVDGVCSACHTAVPKKQLGDIEAGETLETCENCLRYLYIDEAA